MPIALPSEQKPPQEQFPTGVSRKQWEEEIERGLERQQFVLHYQPQVDLETGRILGAEALIRWHHPEHGIVSPAKFIPVVEETELAIPIGRWVMKTAASAAVRWSETLLSGVSVSANVSPRHITNGTLAADVEAVLESTGLQPRLLKLEILESAVLADMDSALLELERVRQLGVSLALDDFGTGYSSLSYLKQMPVNTLKIDRMFVQNVVSDPDDAAIVAATISMAHNIGLHVVAEGVETNAQLVHLTRMGCDQLQGYLASKPLPEEELRQLLNTGSALVQSQAERDLSDRKALVVEDEDFQRKFVTRLLEAQGWQVTGVANAEDAWDILASEDIMVVVADHYLPGISGVEFLEKARRLYPDVIRVLASSVDDVQTIVAAVNRSGVFKFLPKPIDGTVIRDAMDDAYERARALRQSARLLAGRVYS